MVSVTLADVCMASDEMSEPDTDSDVATAKQRFETVTY